jgi:hypothetical protein
MNEIIHYAVRHWWSAFLLTLAFELPVYLLLTRGKASLSHRGAAAVLASACTHPLLWFVWKPLVHDPYVAYIASGEILVVAIESLILWRIARPLSLRRAVLTALVANATSCGLGLLLQRVV